MNTPLPVRVPRTTSALKSVIWRAIGVVILAGVTYFFTHRLVVTTEVTLTHHAVFLGLFYLHERWWARLPTPSGILRNITKALTYELLLGLGLGGLIVYLYTGRAALVTAITGTYTILKLTCFAIYDRYWPEFQTVVLRSESTAERLSGVHR